LQAFLEAVPASVWDRDEKDNTALHWLVSSGEPPAGSVPFLIGKYRAACSCANNTGELPAHIACRNKAVDPEVFYVLLKNSGLKDKKDQDRLAKLLEVTRNKTESNPRKDASKQTTHMNNLQEKQEMLTTFFIQLNRR
jgi:ankyrin repeat protein